MLWESPALPFYRYFESGQKVPSRIREKLREIAAEWTAYPRPHHSLDTLAARALVALHDAMESSSGFTDGLPSRVRRFFDIAAAMNALNRG